jgi:zinc transporter ZupT
VCPACAASHFEEQLGSSAKGGSASGGKFKNVFFLLAVALTVHSLMDGIAIAISPTIAKVTDHSIFFTVAIHKLPEGLALCALLLKAGYSKGRALFSTFLFESSTLAGWWLGFFLIQTNLANAWLNLGTVHIAGGFVYLALHAAINESRDHSPRFILTFFFIGFLFMAFVR